MKIGLGENGDWYRQTETIEYNSINRGPNRKQKSAQTTFPFSEYLLIP